MPEIIPPNARVIEWKYRGASQVAHRPRTDEGRWEVAGSKVVHNAYSLEEHLGLTAENLVVLASFPEPTLTEIVGDAEAFWFGRDGDGIRRVLLGKRYDGMWAGLSASGGDVVYRSLGEVPVYDLSTVTPLVPRGES